MGLSEYKRRAMAKTNDRVSISCWSLVWIVQIEHDLRDVRSILCQRTSKCNTLKDIKFIDNRISRLKDIGVRTGNGNQVHIVNMRNVLMISGL